MLTFTECVFFNDDHGTFKTRATQAHVVEYLKVIKEVEISRLIIPMGTMADTKTRVTHGTHLVVWTLDMENFLLKTYCRSAKRSYILSV